MISSQTNLKGLPLFPSCLALLVLLILLIITLALTSHPHWGFKSVSIFPVSDYSLFWTAHHINGHFWKLCHWHILLLSSTYLGDLISLWLQHSPLHSWFRCHFKIAKAVWGDRTQRRWQEHVARDRRGVWARSVRSDQAAHETMLSDTSFPLLSRPLHLYTCFILPTKFSSFTNIN